MKTVFDDMDKFADANTHVGKGTIIKIFDFDGTIFNSPIPNKELWDSNMFGKLMSEVECGGYGWFQNTITLDDKYIQTSHFNESVVAEIRAATEDPDTVTVLLTGRTTAYEAQVKRILDSMNLTFDHYGFKPIAKNQKIYTMNFKQEFIRELVSMYGDVVSIEMWDDRRKHVDRFNDFLDILELNGGVHFIKESERYMDPSLEREVVERLKEDAAMKGTQIESVGRNVIYYGAFLYPESHYTLLESMKEFIPDGWKPYAHHMTILFGKAKNPEVEAYIKQNIGKNVELKAIKIGISDDAIAVQIESDVPSDNAIPHVTIATPVGGKPFKSNMIRDWEPLDAPITLRAEINAFYG
jgi:hypothetical protein